MRLRYSGEFLSLAGVTWRADIYQEAASDFTVGDLTFPLDPLTIRWDDRSPEEPICGSMATLRIESPGDRTYADLYTEVPGDVRLDVYRNNVLYWSGCLDTETYREPYDRYNKYDVELTFYDFGHLHRIPYSLTGTKTLRQILEAALAASGIHYTAISEAYMSTKFTDDTAVTLAALSIPSENFIDEDGVAFDWERVLSEGVLLPLALRMVQKAGTIWIYDINSLFRDKGTTEDIDWSATGQEMSTGRVFNDIRVTFSPYSRSKMTKDFEYGDIYGSEYINADHSDNDPDYYSFFQNALVGQLFDPDYVAFTIFRSNDGTKCKGLAEIGTNNRYFKIYPLLGGDESEGVAVGFVAGHGSLAHGTTYTKGIAPGSHPQTVALKTVRSYLPALDADGRNDNMVKVVMEMMADPRYNPFDEPEGEFGDLWNELHNYEEYKSWGQQAFVPVAIVLYDANGTALYHYRNAGITSHGHPADSVAKCAAWSEVGDGWISGDASFGDAWLSYYDDELDLITGVGCLGWKTNGQNFGKPWAEGGSGPANRKVYYSDAVGTKTSWSALNSFKKLPKGQFIPYPPVAGYLEVRVYNGVYIFDDTDKFSSAAHGGFEDEDLYSKMRWLLYKAPEVSVVKRTLTFDDSEIDDIEYSGVANVNAKEDLELETICGTAPSACPTARGILMRTSNGQQLSRLKRQGRTESAEQLLIGTLYSQFAARKTVLNGEVTLDPGGLTLYDDAAQEAGVKFLLTSEEQHLRDDVSEACFLQVRPDEYTAE